ncbi:hypothetical protein C8R44DRAFT_848236 [Mycena epipterygia]|nr:hypothetical protein C8R44DRAFT_848236 [Mycena epipterygia]
MPRLAETTPAAAPQLPPTSPGRLAQFSWPITLFARRIAASLNDSPRPSTPSLAPGSTGARKRKTERPKPNISRPTDPRPILDVEEHERRQGIHVFFLRICFTAAAAICGVGIRNEQGAWRGVAQGECGGFMAGTLWRHCRVRTRDVACEK